MKRSFSARGGFTLVEALVALMLIVIVILPVISVFMRESRGLAQTRKEFRGAMWGQQLMETIRRSRWDELSTHGAALTPTTLATIGPDGVGVFDDVDDWNGYSDTVDLYTRQVTVDFVTVSNLGVITTSAGSTNLKRIQVVVLQNGQAENRLVSLVANRPGSGS